MEIKVLGTGCKKCVALEERTKRAVEELEIQATVHKEENVLKIMSYGVMATPALVINEKVAMSGSLPSINEIKELISQFL